jgi:hypothetical protein
MIRFVKTLAAITASCFLFSSAYSQIKILPVGGLVSDIKKVINDYPYQFSHITGDLILENAQSSDYQCNLSITGAEESSITRYSAKTKVISSWTAIMLTTEDFEEAKKKFRSLYSQVNGLSVRSCKLHGVYEAPVEEKKSSNILFSFDANDESFRKLKVELVLYSDLLEWKVKLMIYDREREDDERGKVIED